MSLKIDHRAAENVFEAAFHRATSGPPVPSSWLRRFEQLSDERTYTAILATALLARAVNPAADARVLMVRAGSDGYSARGLFTRVIFELCMLHDIRLGSIGREPHNNQPFFGSARIDSSTRAKVRGGKLGTYDQLVSSLNAANQLSQAEAADAFAAFVRFSLDAAPVVQLELAGRDYDLVAIRTYLRSFVGAGIEGGARGEAVVAAALDLMFKNVRVNAKPNDPSRHWPGDVIVLRPAVDIKSRDASDVLLATEVKEREVSSGEILQFAQNVRAARIRRATYAALHPSSSALNSLWLEDEAWRRHQVSLHVFQGTDKLIGSVLTFTALAIDDAIKSFLKSVAIRLEQKGATTGLAEWKRFVEGLTAS